MTLTIERISAKLTNEQRSYAVQLELAVVPRRVDELTATVTRLISKARLIRGVAVPDGTYTLEYVFDGQLHKGKARIVNGDMLAG